MSATGVLGRALAGVFALLAAGATGAAGAADIATAATGSARAARAATNVSANWAGYAVTLPAGTARRRAFRTVSASWVVQRVACTPGSRSYSSFWVGLGGYYRASRALEQIGTEADCSRAGGSVYDAWYELVPNAPVTVRLRIHPGDSLAARVTVNGRRVALWLRNVTTGASFSRTVRFNAPDVSSAEWIAEAPSACDDGGNCVSLQLANFGTMSYTGASATTVTGQQGTVSDPAWTQTRIDLRQSAGGGRFGVAAAGASASPSALSADGSSFGVSWMSSSTPGPANQAPPGFFVPGTGPAG